MSTKFVKYENLYKVYREVDDFIGTIVSSISYKRREKNVL